MASPGVRERANAHIASEYTNDPEVIWKTISPVGELSWAGCLTWATTRVDPGRAFKIVTASTPEEVYAHYEHVCRFKPLLSSTLLTYLVGDWWVLTEAPSVFFDAKAGKERHVTVTALFMLDGTSGISGEQGWGRYEDPGAPDLAAHAPRVDAVVQGAIANDPDAIVSQMRDDVQGAVRAYSGYDTPYVALDGREAMHEYYARLFESVRVTDIRHATLMVKDWYVFAELDWDVELRSGPHAGRRASFSTAEYMTIGVEGDFITRIGYGTPLTPA